MFVALTSVSKDPTINGPLLSQIAAAMETQLYRDFAPMWQLAGMPVKVYAAPTDIHEADASPLVIFDAADETQALGWHTADNGRIYGKVFWNPIKKSGGTLHASANSLSVTISHEILEMAGDPYASWWADKDDEVQEALEVCDRVEADSYAIDGIHVSNFLGPRAFRNGPGPYDFMRLLKSPWELRPGGYAIRRTGSKVTNVWGQEVPQWKRELKMAAGKRTSERHERVRAAALNV